MKASHILVAGAIGVGAIALVHAVTKKSVTEPSTDPDADLLQWNGDPGKIRYEIPSDLALNGEVLRDFCGSFVDHIDVGPSVVFLVNLPDAIRKAYQAWADEFNDGKVSEEAINDTRVWCIKWLIEDGRTHDIIMNWLNGDYDVTKITLAELDYMKVILENKLDEDVLETLHAMCSGEE